MAELDCFQTSIPPSVFFVQRAKIYIAQQN